MSYSINDWYLNFYMVAIATYLQKIILFNFWYILWRWLMESVTKASLHFYKMLIGVIDSVTMFLIFYFWVVLLFAKSRITQKWLCYWSNSCEKNQHELCFCQGFLQKIFHEKNLYEDLYGNYFFFAAFKSLKQVVLINYLCWFSIFPYSLGQSLFFVSS